MTINPNHRSRTRGRPHVDNGSLRCTRCGRMSTQNRTPSWPGEQLCNSCFYTAMRTYGICPICGHHGVLPAHANRTEPRPVCLACAGIPENYQCRTCHTEGQIYRHRRCARCALRRRPELADRRRRRGSGGDGHDRGHPVRGGPTRKHPHLETFRHRAGAADRALLR
jgi:hypothetical protein